MIRVEVQASRLKECTCPPPPHAAQENPKLGDVVEGIALFKTWLSPVWDSASKQYTQELFLLRSVSFSPAPVLGSRKFHSNVKTLEYLD